MNFYEQIFSRGRATGEGMTHFERLFAAKFGGSPPPEVREYTGAVPVTITADGTPLLDYIISGNTTQNGTPTPENPVMPQGCGNKTANLLPLSDKAFTITAYGSNLTVTCSGGNLYFSGSVTEIPSNYTAWKTNFAFELEAGTYYCNSPSPLGNNFGRYIKKYDDDSNLINSNTYIFTLTEKTKCYLTFYIYQKSVDSKIELMLNTGETALPFEPFGVKIPILSGGVTTPVYLGEVQSIRRIKKLVLDGTESWYEGTSNYYIFIDVSYRGEGIPNSTALSTHTESGVVVNGNGTALFFKKLVFIHSSLADFKTYLQQQYAAGTPVSVWYVLASETTGIVNEPLMRIGDYADTVSKAQAGVDIPTNNGSTTVDVDTTVKPSEVYIKYMG